MSSQVNSIQRYVSIVVFLWFLLSYYSEIKGVGWGGGIQLNLPNQIKSINFKTRGRDMVLKNRQLRVKCRNGVIL